MCTRSACRVINETTTATGDGSHACLIAGDFPPSPQTTIWEKASVCKSCIMSNTKRTAATVSATSNETATATSDETATPSGMRIEGNKTQQVVTKVIAVVLDHRVGKKPILFCYATIYALRNCFSVRTVSTTISTN